MRFERQKCRPWGIQRKGHPSLIVDIHYGAPQSKACKQERSDPIAGHPPRDRVGKRLEDLVDQEVVDAPHAALSAKRGASPTTRRRAIAAYSGFNSIKMESRWCRSATKATVPAPPNGSKTTHGTGSAAGQPQVGCHPYVFSRIPSRMRRYTSLAFCTPAAGGSPCSAPERRLIHR
jgi:hypothetical protein